MLKNSHAVWHPATQMKDHETFPLLNIVKATGCYLECANGDQLFDAISSWWCKSLGHAHPRLKKALLAQIEKFEHVILAGTTNETIATLSTELTRLLPGLTKVFYASDGACAVEIALKMSLHARANQHQTKRTQFIALENGYHGETLGALSVSDSGLYRKPYATHLFPTYFIRDLPYVLNTEDPLWDDCEIICDSIEKQLENYTETATAIILEPIVQGAAGLRLYSRDFLRRLARWAKQHDVHLIFDEIMTGFGRTGEMFACEYAGITPDLMCLSKGLTAGWLPLSCVMASQEIYNQFYSDENEKGFLHSHTYSGNALAASVAVEVINVMREENMLARVNAMGEVMVAQMNLIAEQTGQIKNVRGIGAIVAADFVLHKSRDEIKGMMQRAAELGVMLRPIGQTLYWMPPFIANENDLELVMDVSKLVLES